MSNMYDEDQVRSYIEQIEALRGEVATSKSNHMTFARKKGDEEKEVFDDAKANGIPRKVLAKLLKRRELEDKIDKLDDEIDEDHKPLFVSLTEKFAAYKHPVQTDMFDDGEEADEGGEEPFDPDFVPPAEGDQVH
jgi:uncharacterized protein (UPF0335 family)